jgi:hypothetical protein
MNHIKKFEQFNTNNQEEIIIEGLSSYLMKIPGIKKMYDKAMKIFDAIKGDVKKYLNNLSEDELTEVKKFDLSKVSSLPITEAEEKKDKKTIINKVLRVIGGGSIFVGLVSGIYSMIVAYINQSGEQATPFFLAFTILAVIGGISNIAGTDEEEEKAKIMKDLEKNKK